MDIMSVSIANVVCAPFVAWCVDVAVNVQLAFFVDGPCTLGRQVFVICTVAALCLLRFLYALRCLWFCGAKLVA